MAERILLRLRSIKEVNFSTTSESWKVGTQNALSTVIVIVCLLSVRLQALQSGLYSLDMMESVLARISEIANSRNKARK